MKAKIVKLEGKRISFSLKPSVVKDAKVEESEDEEEDASEDEEEQTDQEGGRGKDILLGNDSVSVADFLSFL